MRDDENHDGTLSPHHHECGERLGDWVVMTDHRGRRSRLLNMGGVPLLYAHGICPHCGRQWRASGRANACR